LGEGVSNRFGLFPRLSLYAVDAFQTQVIAQIQSIVQSSILFNQVGLHHCHDLNRYLLTLRLAEAASHRSALASSDPSAAFLRSRMLLTRFSSLASESNIL